MPHKDINTSCNKHILGSLIVQKLSKQQTDSMFSEKELKKLNILGKFTFWEAFKVLPSTGVSKNMTLL